VNNFDYLLDSLSERQQALFLLRLHHLHTGRKELKAICPQPRRNGENTFPPSFSQERLWFLNQYAPSHPLYNISGGLRLSGRLNHEALDQSLGEIIRRHEILRTNLAVSASSPVQLIRSFTGFRLAVVELQTLPESQRAECARRLHFEEAQRRFHLHLGPLIRMTLIKLRETEHLLLLTMHHVICDRWSIILFIREFVSGYLAFNEGRPSSLPEMPIQYADFAVWQRELLRRDLLDEQMAYWKRQLANAPPRLNFPADLAPSTVQTSSAAEQDFRIGAALTAALKVLNQAEGATLFMTLLAAFQILLYRLTGEPDILVGVPIASRDRAEIEDLLGFFVNTLVVRTKLTGDPTFRETLRQVRRICLEAYDNQSLPFEKVVELLRPDRARSHNPLFQVMFNFQSQALEHYQLPQLTVTPHRTEFVMAKFDLSFELWEEASGINGLLVYRTDIFSGATIARLLKQFETLLEFISRSPDDTINAPDLLTGSERTELIVRETERRKTYAEKLSRAKRQPVSLSQTPLVRVGADYSEQNLPLIICPEFDRPDLSAWIMNNRELIERYLRSSGAILFRGFGINSQSAFEHAAQALTPELLDYHERTSPRTEISPRIYTSTEYPSRFEIPLHNELAYSYQWPMKLWFCCRKPASEGGETPLADSRRVLATIDRQIRDRFRKKGVSYLRNFSRGIDLPWPEVFQTADKSAVEKYCREAQIEFEWRGKDGLRLRQIRDAIVAHPRTGEEVWFNQVILFHPSSLAPAVRDSLISIMGEADLPKNCYYADGSAIEPSIIEEIRGAYRRCTVTFPWEEGDLLLVDNMLVAHGRRPFIGPREILVAMSESHQAPAALFSRGEF